MNKIFLVFKYSLFLNILILNFSSFANANLYEEYEEDFYIEELDPRENLANSENLESPVSPIFQAPISSENTSNKTSANVTPYVFNNSVHASLLKEEYYALADKYLTFIWSKLGSVLSKQEYGKIFKEQKEWISTGRTERANEYAPEFTIEEAFTQATFDRVLELVQLLPPKKQETTFKYEYSGEAEIVFNNDKTEIFIITINSSGSSCELIAEMQGKMHLGWNIFNLADEEDKLMQISVYNLYDELYISDTYLIPENASATHLVCGTSAIFEGKYFKK